MQKLFRAPSFGRMPQIATLLDDIGLPFHKVALFFGVTDATVRRWYRCNQAPRAVYYALYWESSFGRAAADFSLTYHNQLLQGQLVTLQRQNARLLEQLRVFNDCKMPQDVASNARFFKIG